MWAASGRMSVSPKIHTSPTGQSALYSHQNQNHILIKANKIFPVVRRAEKQGSYRDLVVSVKITASTLGKAPTCIIVKKIKLPLFINWEVMLNPTEPKIQKHVLMTYQFTRSLFLVPQWSQSTMLQV